ncbi:50S ribosomal protein L19 [Candidatus Shapirobacteria bacterium CG09_land_8_20_14_0_10_38_17]|uniref:50S ribosomal protein L19 n=1 Tax=Candidatus Shapirobacteria bacterium CG09_land_8_20_14_0_10_38_17 TaxID=1974884 RepID=A0A2H0WRF2_9BACT|nr:MAG: 50S ribosomal protein L19 [Candidatus Shapirobacteria bacterium CG09_land_8_20_14_0_10_38_17]
MIKIDEQSWKNELRVGDKVRVHWGKTIFEGTIIAKKGRGISKTFTVRRIGVNRIAIEQIFPFYSPKISKIDIRGKARKKIRRAKLYYQR